jgi:hypothetical protein
MKVRMIHSEGEYVLADVVAQRLIEAGRATEIELTPSEVKIVPPGVMESFAVIGFDVRPGETITQNFARHGIAPVSEQPSAD